MRKIKNTIDIYIRQSYIFPMSGTRINRFINLNGEVSAARRHPIYRFFAHGYPIDILNIKYTLTNDIMDGN